MPVRVYGSANIETRSADPLTCVECAVLKVNDRGTDDGGVKPGRRPFPKVRWLATDSPPQMVRNNQVRPLALVRSLG